MATPEATARPTRGPKRGPKRWVSTGWLADYYDVSERTIWRWVEQGKLPQPEKKGSATRHDLWALEGEEPAA